MKGGEAVWDLAGTRVPRCVDGPWASPRAGGPLRPPLSCCDEMPAASILSSTAARQTSGTMLHTAREQEGFKTSHKQQQSHQFRDWRFGVVKMLAFRVIPWDLWLLSQARGLSVSSLLNEKWGKLEEKKLSWNAKRIFLSNAVQKVWKHLMIELIRYLKCQHLSKTYLLTLDCLRRTLNDTSWRNKPNISSV